MNGKAMRKQIILTNAIITAMLFLACSSDGENNTDDISTNVKSLAFNVSQEECIDGTRVSLSVGNTIVWETGDQINVFDGLANRAFMLSEGAGKASGVFRGIVSAESTDFTAFYPYTSSVSINEEGEIANIVLPSNQIATNNGFDKNAALMMAYTRNSTKLVFKNAVGYIKVTPKFACSKIEIKSKNQNTVLAGNATISYNGGEPKLDFTSNYSYSIILLPESGKTSYPAGTYYIAVPAITLAAGWSITFTASTDNKEYIRKGIKEIKFARNKILNLGEFNTTDDHWVYNVTKNGIVAVIDQVDMGPITLNDRKYQLIFTKSNLTKKGIGIHDYDYGDYFAWAAEQPWCTAYTKTTSSVTPTEWNNTRYKTTYAPRTTPYGDYEGICTKYTTDNVNLEMSDDAARIILKGDWKIPTRQIWTALRNASKYTWSSGYVAKNGYKGLEITSKITGNSIFLPIAGKFSGDVCKQVGVLGYYWIGTAYSSSTAYYMYFDGNSRHEYSDARWYGYPIRPVRLARLY